MSRVDLLGAYDRPDADIRNDVAERITEAGFSLQGARAEITVPRSACSMLLGTSGVW